MHFHHAQRSARLVNHGVHGEIEARNIRKQAFHLQVGVGSQSVRGDGILVRHQYTWRFDRRDTLV